MKILFVHSVNSKYNSPFILEQRRAIEKLGHKIDLFLINGQGAIGYLKNLLRLKKVLLNTDYSLIHAHYGLSGLLATLQRKTKVIVTFHGSDINSSKIIYFSKIAHILAAYSIFVSDELQQKLRKNGTQQVIPCGVDFDLFYPVDKYKAREILKLPMEKKLILFASSFKNKVKNYPLTAKALKILNNPQIELIELWGYSRKEVNLLLNAVDLVVLTSFTEGSPQIIKEAMSVNCPIVTTEVGDVREVIGDTEGCYITNFDSKEIADSIKKALKFNSRTIGREKVIKYNNNEIAKLIVKIYESIL